MSESVRQVFLGMNSDPAPVKTFDLIEALYQDILKKDEWGLSLNDTPKYDEIKKLGAGAKKELVLSLITFWETYYDRKTDTPESIKKDNKAMDYYAQLGRVSSLLFESLLRQKLEFTSTELITFFKRFREVPDNFKYRFWQEFHDLPVTYAIGQLEKHVKKEGLDEDLKTYIEEMLQWKEFDSDRFSFLEKVKTQRAKLEKILSSSGNADYKPQPYLFPEEDSAGKYLYGKYVNELMAGLKAEEQDAFYKVFYHALTATTSKPSQKWLKQAEVLIKDLKKNRYKQVMQEILGTVMGTKVLEIVEVAPYYRDSESFPYRLHKMFLDQIAILLKGLVWTMMAYHDRKTLSVLAQLTERAFQKIPGEGPASGVVGNACIYVLAHAKGVEGISHLSRLKLKIRQNNTQKLIQKYIDEVAENRGLSSLELEELSVPDFGLVEGKKTVAFQEHQLEVAVTGIGKTQLTWYKPDGSTQKSDPAFVKSDSRLKEKLKGLKEEVKQIQKYSTAQRDRIDRLFVRNQTWSYEKFQAYYLDHGLVSLIARKLIWTLTTGEQTTEAVFHKGQWEDVKGQPVEVGPETQVVLWHPIHSDTVMAWRDRLAVLEIQQPMKQAYREVYLLTEAEVNTRTYSNRMAAHILKQHQFNALTALRGWKYTLLSNFDGDADSSSATISLPEHGIMAEYLIHEVQSDDTYGMLPYVSTDLVRFTDTAKEEEVMRMEDVPKIVLSEVMRDVDLFVGVSSVGNDPEWRDNGGMPEYHDYWSSYSFGYLTEVAKTRKEVLATLLPRLKIKNVAGIEGRFLKIQGKVRNYKIHIGSTNILMEPNDQYLCIVPDRKSTAKSDKVFLPFEGDRGLSLVLSKAFLLAEDDKITDPTILSQLQQ
ncbi:DUF4132 domain-containing protein [Rapidithrix thailandica]|uniref:DUF4132 domain-containing protein n=1 Tax=Rapidithrix thailandica TaxID=413964 RepID=A0AAW9S5W2_9BACT